MNHLRNITNTVSGFANAVSIAILVIISKLTLGNTFVSTRFKTSVTFSIALFILTIPNIQIGHWFIKSYLNCPACWGTFWNFEGKSPIGSCSPRWSEFVFIWAISLHLMQKQQNASNYKHLAFFLQNIKSMCVNQVGLMYISMFSFPLFFMTFTFFHLHQWIQTPCFIKFIYSEKATKFCEISSVDLTVTT